VALSAIDETDPATSSASLSHAAADISASAIRSAGGPALSPADITQLAKLIGDAAEAAQAMPGPFRRALAWTVAMFLAFLLAVSVVAGVWIADQRVRAIEAKLVGLDAIKLRQDALVLHLLASVDKIADAQGVKLPRVPAVLRIAEAQAAEAANQ